MSERTKADEREVVLDAWRKLYRLLSSEATVQAERVGALEKRVDRISKREGHVSILADTTAQRLWKLEKRVDGLAAGRVTTEDRPPMVIEDPPNEPRCRFCGKTNRERNGMGCTSKDYRASIECRYESADPTPAREGMPVVGWQYECPECEDGGVVDSEKVKYCSICAGDNGRDVRIHRDPLVRLEDAERAIGERDERIRELEELWATDADEMEEGRARIRELEAERDRLLNEVGNLLEVAPYCRACENPAHECACRYFNRAPDFRTP